LKPGLADPGLEPDRVEKKIDKEKTQCNPVDPAIWLQPVDFFFLTKTMSLWFKKKIDLGDPVKTWNSGFGPGRPPSQVWKTMVKTLSPTSLVNVVSSLLYQLEKLKSFLNGECLNLQFQWSHYCYKTILRGCGEIWQLIRYQFIQRRAFLKDSITNLKDLKGCLEI